MAKFVRQLLTPFRIAGLLPRSVSGETKVAAEVLDRDTDTRPAGEHMKRLRRLAKAADKGEGQDLTGLSRDELREALSAAPR